VFCGPEMLRGETFAKLEELEGGRCAPNERFAAKEWFAASDVRCDGPSELRCDDAFEKFEVVRDERAAKLA
jgi:hypothetical protein